MEKLLKMISRIKGAIKVILGKSKAINNPVPIEVIKPYYCPVCSNNIEKFNRLADDYLINMDTSGYFHSMLFETLNIYSYSCPICGAADRDRLYSQYLKKTGIINDNEEFRILDIAPSFALKRFIKSKFPLANYRTADLMMEGVDDKVDITNMIIYPENHFNFIICSHVLEHIDNDILAMRELYRVLKVGGNGIVMVPILLTIEDDYENVNANTPKERLKHFGQDDHVRIYSKKGFLKKLEQVGFKVNQFGEQYFGEDTFKSNGIQPRSVLYIVEK